MPAMSTDPAMPESSVPDGGIGIGRQPGCGGVRAAGPGHDPDHPAPSHSRRAHSGSGSHRSSDTLHGHSGRPLTEQARPVPRICHE